MGVPAAEGRERREGTVVAEVKPGPVGRPEQVLRDAFIAKK